MYGRPSTAGWPRSDRASTRLRALRRHLHRGQIRPALLLGSLPPPRLARPKTGPLSRSDRSRTRDPTARRSPPFAEPGHRTAAGQRDAARGTFPCADAPNHRFAVASPTASKRRALAVRRPTLHRDECRTRNTPNLMEQTQLQPDMRLTVTRCRQRAPVWCSLRSAGECRLGLTELLDATDGKTPDRYRSR